jgi:release factor glutamine methyltransferase
MPTSIQLTLHHAQQQLRQAGMVDSPKIDTEILLAEALHKNHSYLYTWPEKELTDSENKTFQSLLSARVDGKPIAYILGYQEFWGLEFIVNEHTLIPRADTEIIVEKALFLLKKCPGGYQKTLDLGTGSGAIICSLKHELPKIDAFAVDFDQKTLKTAKLNAKKHNLEITFSQSDWFSAFKKSTDNPFNIIVSNPPYIEDQDPHLMQGDLRFEPGTALTSGKDGLEDIRKICQQAPNHLAINGWLLIEHGYNQADNVKSIFEANLFKNIATQQDYAGNDRVTYGQLLTNPTSERTDAKN